jgi:integrase/recombinase XerD
VERVSVVVDSALSERGQEPKELVIGLESFCFLTCGRRFSESFLLHSQSHALASVWSGHYGDRLMVGHEDVQTTHVYLQADLATKEKALNKLAPPETKVARFKPCD